MWPAMYCPFLVGYYAHMHVSDGWSFLWIYLWLEKCELRIQNATKIKCKIPTEQLLIVLMAIEILVFGIGMALELGENERNVITYSFYCST